MPSNSNTRTRAERLLDERAKIQIRWEDLVAEVNGRADGGFTESENDMVATYRTRTEEIDTDLETINGDLEREEKAEKASKALRAHIAGSTDGVDLNGEDIVYRSFSAYGRDYLISKVPEIQDYVGRELGPAFVEQAKDRLGNAVLRAPANTLSSDVAGLLPPTHLNDIMDIINTDRPVVASGRSVDLSRGSLTYPKITQRPTVSKQSAEKTEVSSQKLTVDMETINADTYLGAGNLSWQMVNWSVPSGLDLFFRLLAEQYALATETAACNVLSSAAVTVADALAGTSADTFTDWLTAIMEGVEAIYDSTTAIPNTLYLSPDMFFLAAVITSDTRVMLIDAGNVNLQSLSGRVSGLNVVTSRGFAAGTAIVGDSRALLVGETPGAPVQLRAVEPAIGGYEVAIIGAFKAQSFDDDRFADIGPTT